MLRSKGKRKGANQVEDTERVVTQEEKLEQQGNRNKIDTSSVGYKTKYDQVNKYILNNYPDMAVEALFSDEAKETLKTQLKTNFKMFDAHELDLIMSELIGLGKFETIILDDNVTDIGFNGDHLWIETLAGKQIYDDPSIDEAYVNRVIMRFANYAHRDFSQKEPLLNTQLGNIRISATHKSVSPFGTSMSMRHARAKLAITEDNFADIADMRVLDLLKAFVLSESNLLMDGVVGSAKTEVTKTLINYIPNRDKIIMIEDTLETHIKTIYPDKDVLNWVLLDNMEPNDLISQSKRNNPVWVILTEARDHAIFQIHQSVKAGFKIMLSLHSEDAAGVPDVMIDLMKQKYSFDEDRMLKEILKYYDLGVHMEKRVMDDGRTIRYIGEIVEYTPDGLVTLYTRDLDQTVEGGQFIDRFVGKVSERKMEQMRLRNVECTWNDEIDAKTRTGRGGE